MHLRFFIAPRQTLCYRATPVGEKSSIEWTDATWNPVTGCSKVSPGCKFCYAERFGDRFRGVSGHPYEQGFDLKLWPERLDLPLRWTTPRMIFVNSMSDLFHEQVPDEFVEKVFDTMERATLHTFQLLTKRSCRLADWTHSRYALAPGRSKKMWPRNVWAGVSVETELYASRIADLQRLPASTRFLSLEPLLGPVNLYEKRLRGIHWVIVGGESGCSARAMKPEWARAARYACANAGVPFFFKQWGAHNAKGERVGKKAAGRRLDGRVWNQRPQFAT
jgi:protein gp37